MLNCGIDEREKLLHYYHQCTWLWCRYSTQLQRPMQSMKTRIISFLNSYSFCISTMIIKFETTNVMICGCYSNGTMSNLFKSSMIVACIIWWTCTSKSLSRQIHILVRWNPLSLANEEHLNLRQYNYNKCTQRFKWHFKPLVVKLLGVTYDILVHDPHCCCCNLCVSPHCPPLLMGMSTTWTSCYASILKKQCTNDSLNRYHFCIPNPPYMYIY